ncbi:MAG: glycosyltransferase family protein, partial [Planctomycetota bacterium]
MRTIAHVTHEVVHKMGGIGAVLQGLLTSEAYRKDEQRTILIGPMFAAEGSAEGRLGSAGQVLYSSTDGIYQHPLSEALDGVCNDFHVDIVYGRRTITNPHTGIEVSPEAVLIDVSRMKRRKVNGFKSKLWQSYGIDSTRYEEAWDYDLYLRLALPALAVLHALGAVDTGDQCVIMAHEYMGMPTALAAKLDASHAFKTIFYAHEVSAVRRIVEEHPGHDVTFYNIISSAGESGRYIDNIFGPQDHYYRHALVKASRHCDGIFAVGDNVAREIRFLGEEFADVPIHTTYNGVPAETITLAEKRVSGNRLRDYAERLLGHRPDYIFTHVTRTAVSKGLWRDIRVLEYLEQDFRKSGRTAVLLVLSTEIGPRKPEDIREMERWWRWPVAHREVSPDLSDGEALFYQGVQEFN